MNATVYLFLQLHLCSFLVLPVIDEVTINISADFAYGHIYNSFGKPPRKRIVNLYGKSVFSFLRNHQTVSQSGCNNFAFPLAVIESCYCPTSLHVFCILVVLDFAHCRCLVASPYCFNLFSLRVWRRIQFFLFFITIYISPL